MSQNTQSSASLQQKYLNPMTQSQTTLGFNNNVLNTTQQYLNRNNSQNIQHSLQFKDALYKQKQLVASTEYQHQLKNLEDLHLKLKQLQTHREKDCKQLIAQEQKINQLKQEINVIVKEQKSGNINSGAGVKKGGGSTGKGDIEEIRQLSNSKQNPNQTSSATTLFKSNKEITVDNDKISQNLNHLVKINFDLQDQQQQSDPKVAQLLLKQLSLFKSRLSDKDAELRTYVESNLQDNQQLKDQLQSLQSELQDLKDECIMDDIRIYEIERSLDKTQLEREVAKQWEKEKAYERGGQEEALKVEEDYEIKKSKEKAEDILARMREKIEAAQHLVINDMPNQIDQ
eukprot:403341263